TFVMDKNIDLMTRHGVYTKAEMMARREIYMEKYSKVIHIEAMTMVDMVQHTILHAVSSYAGHLCETIVHKKQAVPGISCKVEEALAAALSSLNDDLMSKAMELKTALETVSFDGDPEMTMHFYHDTVFARMNELRVIVDKLETLTASDYWPYPTYYDLLFSV
ncbi:MAG: glutamine synthetase type III, partial [Oscillospiraceae bacterium]|nr:glutamine synthetase type III [Oscillospiraceae bacterium]